MVAYCSVYIRHRIQYSANKHVRTAERMTPVFIVPKGHGNLGRNP